MSDVRERMQETARTIETQLPAGTGFILFAFDFGSSEERRMEYVSNAKREDAVELLKEWIEKTESSWGEHLGLGPQAPG